MGEPILVEGIVLRAVSGVYSVQADGHVLHCTLRGNMKKELQFSTSQSVARRVTRVRRPRCPDTVTVGDRVRVTCTSHGVGVIEEVLPRRNQFSRAGFRGQEQVVVCNLDQLAIVFACAEPQPDLWKLDRFLVAAELAALRPLVVANKADLVSEAERESAFGLYERLGYSVLFTSAKCGRGVEDLCGRLKGLVTAFVGPSGVGKSSLLNAVQPGLNLRTTEIGYVTYKGRHTTTAAQLIPLRFSGWVADTPGLRQLELLEKDRETVIQGFPEMRCLLGECRFDNCRHETEPDCAIKDAVERGAICERRYRSMLEMSA